MNVSKVKDAKSLCRYDHHQKSFNESVSSLLPGKPWVTKLSSAGLVYVYYGKEILKVVLETTDEVKVEKMFDRVSMMRNNFFILSPVL